VLGRDGPLGFSTRVTIEEIEAPGAASLATPSLIKIRAEGSEVSLEMTASVEDHVATRMGGPFSSSESGAMSFLQLRARFPVTARLRRTPICFTELGAAETFRGD